MLRSNVDWSGWVFAGVTLGNPAVNEAGEFVWDGNVPSAWIDADGYLIFDEGVDDESGVL